MSLWVYNYSLTPPPITSALGLPVVLHVLCHNAVCLLPLSIYNLSNFEAVNCSEFELLLFVPGPGHLTKTTYVRKDPFGSQCSMLGKARWQGHVAAAHAAPTVWKQGNTVYFSP